MGTNNIGGKYMEEKGLEKDLNEHFGLDEESKTFKEIEIEIKGLVAANKMLVDYQKESRKQNKRMYRIILALITGMILECVVLVGGFIWYESQFEYADSDVITEEYSTEGDNANINKVEGNQYNDNATHNVSGN